MNAEIRQDLLAALARLSALRPEWRLGQTMANLAMTAGRMDPGGVWDLEDDEALAAAQALIAQYLEIATTSVGPNQRQEPDSSAFQQSLVNQPGT